MTKIILILGLIGTGLLYSGFRPIYLPDALVTTLDTLISYVYLWNGIIPVLTIIDGIIFILLVELAIFFYKAMKWLLS